MTVSNSHSFPPIIGWSFIYYCFMIKMYIYDAKINLFLDIALSV